MKLYEIKPDDMLKILNKESGAWGVSGVSSDYRDIEDGYEMNDYTRIICLIFPVVNRIYKNILTIYKKKNHGSPWLFCYLFFSVSRAFA